MWTYDKIAVDNSMAEAFRVFANRALCQESVWFLEEVSRWGHGTFCSVVLLLLLPVETCPRPPVSKTLTLLSLTLDPGFSPYPTVSNLPEELLA